MKYLTLLLMLLAGELRAQAGLVFDKRFVECEDKWVAFQPNKDGSYSYGFIYIDAQAGLTMKVDGHFTIDQAGHWLPQKLDSTTNMLTRLSPNQVRVALIPAAKFTELRILAVPNWLHFYKTDTTSVAHYFRWGFLYNSWDEPARALPYLLRAARLAPADKQVLPELAYTYNALEQYDQAIPVATQALAADPANCYVYNKELAYAQCHLTQLAQAAATYRQGQSLCTNKAMKAEIAHNIAAQYFSRHDKPSFDYWATEVKRWATPGDQFMQNITKMAAQLGNYTRREVVCESISKNVLNLRHGLAVERIGPGCLAALAGALPRAGRLRARHGGALAGQGTFGAEYRR